MNDLSTGPMQGPAPWHTSDIGGRHPWLLTGDSPSQREFQIFLDHAADLLCDTDTIPAIWGPLFTTLRQRQKDSQGADWYSPLRDHRIGELIQEAPSVAWSFQKPRGYAGDAHLIDFLYEHPTAQPEVAAGSRELLAQLAAQKSVLAQLGGEALPVQPAHHDFRAANLIWDGEQIAAVLDFEELRSGHRVEDLAWAAVHLGTLYHDWGPVPPAVHELFLAAYRAEIPPTAEEEAWLPILMRWHGLDLARK